MTDYRYIFGTLRSEQVIEEIPLYGTYMSMEMNAGGDFQGTFQLDMTGKDNATLLSACIPGRTWVACERNGICIWHGFVWSRVYSAQSKSVQLFAQSFEKYPEKRRVMQDLFYEDVEQKAIFSNLWGLMMTDYGSNVNVNLPSSPASGVLKSLASLYSDNKYYNEVMSAIADSSNGFDWYINVTKDGVNYRKDLLMGYPNLGTNPFPGLTVFEFPGNITQYYFTEAMADAGTDVFVVGAGEGSTQILGFLEDTALIDSGMARWDVNVSRTDVDSQAIIDQMTMQELERRRAPMPVIKLQVKADKTPEFGSYNLGDTCGIYIKDPRFPTGMMLQKRLLRWELTPQSSDHAEEASLTFEGDPDV
jgi:hypothetical protein